MSLNGPSSCFSLIRVSLSLSLSRFRVVTATAAIVGLSFVLLVLVWLEEKISLFRLCVCPNFPNQYLSSDSGESINERNGQWETPAANISQQA